MSHVIELRQGGAEVSLLPHLGGAVGGFTIKGKDVLRPTPLNANDPLQAACFPMVPYANRIAGGRFAFAGRVHALPPNHPVSPHPLHGIGWLRPWSVSAQDGDSALLSCSHSADASWPWDWTAIQRFELSERALRIVLALTNTGQEAMPAGLGLHPYFTREPGDALCFEAAGVWQNDAEMIPLCPLAADALGNFGGGAVPCAESLIDNTYFGWTGAVSLGAKVTLTARGSSFLHVFAPPGEDFLCLEPTSQMPDAINQPSFTQAGGTVLAPGATQTLELEISVSA